MTNYVKQKFQWFFDMATNTSACQRIDISAGGDDIYKRLSPFFGAFKHFKLGAVKIRMVPAATLPVDPTGLSYEAGENTVDPRDMFNPGLVRITNGEDIQPATGIDEESYYATMLDKRWYKFRLQAGFKRTATPLFWGVGQVRQDITPGASWNLLYDRVADGNHHEDMAFMEQCATTDEAGGYFMLRQAYGPGFTDKALFQTGQKIRMGWLPTDAFEQYNQDGNVAFGLNPIPDVPIITVILPKAYKTKMYYRVFVEESVMFKDAVAINPYEADTGFVSPTDRYVVPVNYRVMGGARVAFNDPIAGGGFNGDN